MNNVKEPINFSLTTTSQEFLHLLRDGCADRDVISILGRSFSISCISETDHFLIPQAKASFAEVTLPAWVGIGLPPVGTVCEIYEGDAAWGYQQHWIGTEVKVRHTFKNALGQYMAAIESGTGECACFIVGCLRPVRTPEQIAAEEREKAIEDLYFTINWAEGRETWSMISKLRKADYAKAIDAGYRKQVAP